MASKEADFQLAISAISARQFQSNCHAAAVYNIPEQTILYCCASKPARCNCYSNSKKLTELEEEVIVNYILNLD
jgi:hypothetical protein